MTNLYEFINPKTKKHSPMISKATFDIIKANAEVKNWIVLRGVHGIVVAGDNSLLELGKRLE